MKPNAEPTCKVCKQIRMFLLFAVPIVMLIATRPDVAVPSIPIEFIFTNFVVISLVRRDCLANLRRLLERPQKIALPSSLAG